MAFWRSKFRQARRLAFLVGVFVFAGLDHFFRRGRRWNPNERAAWQKRWSEILLKGIGFEVRVRGEPPKGGFIAPNHLGYMDIIVLASVAPQVFLSKAEVGNWPVVGAYTKMAGTLFIDRTRRKDVANKERSFAQVVDAGLNMTFFLEGTSTDGSVVLPFRSSLLEPVVKNGWPVTPAYLEYGCEGGDVSRDVCWWGDMGFGSHLLRMCKVRRIYATVVFGAPRRPGTDRKELALDLYRQVRELGGKSEPGVASSLKA